MSQYCDSLKLENDWFNWLLASSTPNLEPYRKMGILATKVIDFVMSNKGNYITRNGKRLTNPSFPRRLHCLILPDPIFFETTDGVIPDDIQNKLRFIDNEYGQEYTKLPQYTEDVDKLLSDDYILENTEIHSWHCMLNDIDMMCRGIATKFNFTNEEEKTDFANDALLQITNKLKRKKLVYIPGKAPVFNLLTTTIYRCMYSIINRRNSQKKNIGKLVEDMKNGKLPKSHRSFRYQTGN